MDESIDRNFRRVRFRMSIVSLFAALAVLLAGVGIYGAIAFSVVQRSREFALRIALGALPSSIRRIAIARTARLTLLAAAGGIAISLAIGKMLGCALYLVPHQNTGVLYGVTMHDPFSIAAASGILIAIALSASLIRRSEPPTCNQPQRPPEFLDIVPVIVEVWRHPQPPMPGRH
jgi:putative ABC transport system permease protein